MSALAVSRARGAADGGAVDLAEAGITEKIRAADQGQDLTGGRVEDHGRNRSDAEAAQLFPGFRTVRPYLRYTPDPSGAP